MIPSSDVGLSVLTLHPNSPHPCSCEYSPNSSWCQCAKQEIRTEVGPRRNLLHLHLQTTPTREVLPGRRCQSTAFGDQLP